MPFAVTTPNAAVLKESTQALHADVENLLMPKLQALCTHDDYAVILRMFYGFFSPLEGLVQQQITPADLPDLAQRRKAQLILQDLAALHFSVRGISVCTQLPVIDSKAAGFGALYVMEGSTLGGKMIARMLTKNPTLSLPDEAVQFFFGYGEQTGPKWKNFLSALNGVEDVATLANSANATFYALKCWMQQVL